MSIFFIFENKLYTMKYLLSFLILLIFLVNSNLAKNNFPSQIQTENKSDTSLTKDLPILIQLPNSEWNTVVKKSPSIYIFKRNAIIDSAGRSIVPAIMVYFEDPTGIDKDVVIFTSKKMQPFLDRGVKVPKILNWENKDYPLIPKNALFMRGEYTSNGLNHIIFMIYIIDKHEKAFQIYMDMTTELTAKYESEFWSTIHSINEKP